MFHHIEPRSVRSYLAGIVSELKPSYPCVWPNRYSPLVVWTLKGSMQHFLAPLQQKAPLTRDDLKHVYQHLPRPLSHDNLLFLIMLLVGFFGLLRLRELVQPDSSSPCSMSKISMDPSPFPVQVFTDHRNLTYFWQSQALSQHQAGILAPRPFWLWSQNCPCS